MKEIKLRNSDKVVIVDDEDFERLSKIKWYSWCNPLKSKDLFYAVSKGVIDGSKGLRSIRMHRIIMNAPKGVMVDHIDRNSLNNQKSNLRLCNSWQNNSNCKIHKTNKSGFRGVCWHKQNKNYRAYISVNNKTIHIGSFDCPIEASKARDEACKNLRGEFSILNQV